MGKIEEGNALVVTDHGWKFLLNRGLDIFQHHEMNDAVAFANRLQQYRACKAFEVTFLRVKPSIARATNSLKGSVLCGESGCWQLPQKGPKFVLVRMIVEWEKGSS